jgi:hypothetical protein
MPLLLLLLLLLLLPLLLLPLLQRRVGGRASIGGTRGWIICTSALVCTSTDSSLCSLASGCTAGTTAPAPLVRLTLPLFIAAEELYDIVLLLWWESGLGVVL